MSVPACLVVAVRGAAGGPEALRRRRPPSTALVRLAVVQPPRIGPFTRDEAPPLDHLVLATRGSVWTIRGTHQG